MTRFEKRRKKCLRIARFEKPEANSGRIAKNTLVLYFRMLAVLLVGLYTGRVIFNALGVADYGLQSIAGGVIGMIVFLNGSLSGASSRFLTVEMGRGTIGSLKRTFSTIFTVHFILACIFTIVLETVGLMFLETKLNIDPTRIAAVKWSYHCGVVTTFLSITQVPYSAILVAHERMGAFAWMAIYDVLVKLLIALSLERYGGDRLMLLATLGTVSAVATIVIYRIYCIRNFTEARFRRVFDKSLLKPIFSFAGWHIATQTVIMLNSQGVLMLNQRYFGPTLVAAISIGATLNTHIQGFIGNFKTAANPQIIKLYAAGCYEESKRLLTETILFSVFLLLFFGIPAWFYSKDLLLLWLGSKLPELSPLIAKIILVSAFFSLFEVSFYVILYAAGRIKENMYLNVVGGLLTLALVFYLVRWQHNPVASVCVSAGYNVVLGLVFKPLLLHYIAGYSLVDFMRIFVPSFVSLGICVLVAMCVRWAFPKEGWLSILACGVIVSVNAGLLYFIVASASMKEQLIKIITRVPHVGTCLSRILVRLGRPFEPLTNIINLSAQ